MLRVGVIGIGFGQRVLVPAFRREARCEITAVAASTEERARRVADEAGIPGATGDWRNLVESKEVDIVAVAVPPDQQPAMIEAAIAAGKHIFCEKPLALDAATAQRLAEAAQRAGVAHVIDFEFTAVPAWTRLKQELSNGRLGGVRQVILGWHIETRAAREGLDSWKTRPSQGGGAVGAFASHSFHYLEWLFGPVVRLSAHTHPARETDRESLLLAHLEFASGARGSVSIGCNSFSGNGHRLEVYGDLGSAILHNAGADYIHGFDLRVRTREDADWVTAVTDAGRPAPDDGRVDAVAVMVRRLCDAIEGGAAAFPGMDVGARVQRLLDAVYDSAKSGGWISTNE